MPKSKSTRKPTIKFPENPLWLTRIENANKYYKQWEERFKCRKLEEYWEGYQWRNIVDIPYYRPYVVNLVFSEIRKKLANILYQNLEYNFTPRPGNYGINPEFAMQSAAYKQDFVNEIIARENKDNNFNDQVHLCAQDSYFRFAAMECGFAADWRNPAKPPVATEAHIDSTASEDSKVIADEDVPENERIFYRRIKPSRFRVSVSDDPRLSNCHWTGYYTYISKDTLSNTKGLKLPKDFDNYKFSLNSEYISAKLENNSNRASSDSKDMMEAMKHGDVCKSWHIWDNIVKVRYLIIEPTYDVIWSNKDDGGYEYLPFATHRHDFRFDGWYPVPPVSQWVSAQDEINQAREQMRNYRRRFTRKFKHWGVDQEELEKFKNEIDGEMIAMKSANSFIEGIGNPEIGISIQDGLNASRDDFNIVSGSSSDLSTAQADRTTATQSKITAQKAQIIESIEQIEFTKFYKQLGRLTLVTAIENFSDGIWAKSSVNPGIDPFQTLNNPSIAPVFRYITTQQINDGFDIDVDITPVNASPQKMQEEMEKFTTFMAMIMQYPIIMSNPVLIREAAFRTGYRNEKVIQSMIQAATMQLMEKTNQMNVQNQTGQEAPPGLITSLLQGGGNNGSKANAGNGAAGNMIRNAAPAVQQIIDKQLMRQ